MLLSVKNYVLKNINKIITLIFSILFCVSFFIYEGYWLLTIYTAIALFAFNVFDFLTNGKISAIFEAIIYEIIALMGIYFINWYYVLVFVLVAEVVHIFKSRVVLSTIIFTNSLSYVLMYLDLAHRDITRGFNIWYILTFLFISIALSIYFINDGPFENHNNSDEKQINYEELLTKYNELIFEHQNILFLKDVMDLSIQKLDIKELAIEVNKIILRKIEDIDYSTIFIYSDKRKEFKIVSSNVPMHYHKTLSNVGEFEFFEDVFSSYHVKVLSSELGLTYPSAVERSIRSSFAFPLHTQNEMLGLVLMESTDSQVFKNLDINKFNLIRYNISLLFENKQWLEKIQRMALVDGLTGVYNRNYLYEFMEKQMKWHKENGRVFCLVLYDVDKFKKFNDTYGHLFGDLVLKELSNLVKNSIRETDLVARYGGEEFIIVFTDANAEIARNRTEQIRKSIENMTIRNEEGVEAKVTVSFGIAEFGESEYNIEMKEIIERADQALYKSKENGRNQVTVYNA